MKKVAQLKKTGSLTPKLIGLVLFGVLAGGVVLAGCGSDTETEETTTTNTTTTETDTD